MTRVPVSRLLPFVLLAAVALVVILLTTGGDKKYVVYAELDDAGGILHNYNVKVGEVPAGQVKDIKLGKDDTVILKMELDKDAAPIGAGATAKVRPVNLLGEKYVDLDPGDLSKPQKSGTTIPKSRTGIPVELDDALNVLDPDTRGALRIIINEAGLALAGHGTDFNQTLTDLPPALDKAKEFVGEAAAENKQLDSAIVQGDRVLNEVNNGREDFADLVSSAGDALETVAERRAKLGQTLQTAPGALAQLRTTLTTLQGASDDLTPAAADLRRATPALASTLQRAPQFADDARLTLNAARKVAPALSRLGRRSTPTLKRIRPTAKRLGQFASDFQPLLDSLDKDKAARVLLNFIDGWAGVTQTRDAVGHVFRLRLTYDSEVLTSALQRYLPGGLTPAKTKKQDKAPAKSIGQTVTDTTKPLTDGLDKTTKGLTGKINETVTKTLQGVNDTVKGAVKGLPGGLGDKLANPQPAPKSQAGDASKLLDYLLGGK